ncbi:MAG: nucleoside permease [Gemmatimonadetes bacterium]|nr:nucleoside permease [Gemmatimonadota bacterium]
MSPSLSLMMFLQFFIWGALFSTIAVYMSAHGMVDLTHWPYTVNPVAAIISPFFLGLVADRYFAPERILGWLHILAGGVMLLVPRAVDSPLLFILLLLAYNICYMPTLGLVNAITFHRIEDREAQYPLIRVFGTVGWIAAGLFISFVLGLFTSGVIPEETAWPLYTTGIAGLVMGLYSFTLGRTPPAAAGRKASLRSVIGLDALQELGSRSFYLFILSALLLCIPLAFYYNFTQIYLGATGFTNIAGTQTLGQFSEVFLMLCMPFFFRRLGVKRMLLIAMAAWIVRYGLFSLGAPDALWTLIVTGIILHGICYDFFFVTAHVYMDQQATPANRGQAQGLFVLVSSGLGMLIGAQIAGRVYNAFLGSTGSLSLSDWQVFWILPAALVILVLILFAAGFKAEMSSSGQKRPSG